jgi:hypothetical protein
MKYVNKEYDDDSSYDWNCVYGFKNLGKHFISTVSNICDDNYLDYYDKMQYSYDISPKDKCEFILFTLEEFKKLSGLTYVWIHDENIKKTNDNRVNQGIGYSQAINIDNEKGTVTNYHGNWYGNGNVKTIEEYHEQVQPGYYIEYLQNGKIDKIHGRSYTYGEYKKCK